MSTHPSLSQAGFLFLSIVTIVSLPRMLPYSFHSHPRPEKVGVRGEGKGMHRHFRSDHTSLVPWHDSRNHLSSHLTRDILATLSQGRQLWFGAMVTKGCDSEIAKNTILINYLRLLKTPSSSTTIHLPAVRQESQRTETAVSGNWQLDGAVLDFWTLCYWSWTYRCVWDKYLPLSYSFSSFLVSFIHWC